MNSLKDLVNEVKADPSVQKIGRTVILLGLTVGWWFASGGYKDWIEQLVEEKTEADREKDSNTVALDTDQAGTDADNAASAIDSL